METLYFQSDDLTIDRAASLLKRGELVAIPTETVYGLAALVSHDEALKKIFDAKGRPSDNPLIVHIARISDAEHLAREIPATFYRLAERFFPGPLTLILRRHPSVSSLVSGGQETIAIRMPNHPVALKLIRAAGGPLAAPSANLSGRPSPTTAEHVLQDLQGKIAAVVDGGPCAFGLESTVTSLVHGDKPIVLRPGAITSQQISEALNCDISITKHEEQPLSPGMKYRHYAPKATVRLFMSWAEVEAYVRSVPLKVPLLMARDAIPASLQRFRHRSLLPQTLYDALRSADLLQCDEVLVMCDEETRRHDALMNRLGKAAQQI